MMDLLYFDVYVNAMFTSRPLLPPRTEFEFFLPYAGPQVRLQVHRHYVAGVVLTSAVLVLETLV